MAKKKVVKKSEKKAAPMSFSVFITQPHIAAALLVFGLIALFLSILEFSQAVSY